MMDQPDPEATTLAEEAWAEATVDSLSPAFATELLSHFWARPEEEEVRTWRRWATLQQRLAEDLGIVCADLVARAERAGVPSLLEEYERLFIGPGPVPCPPYESYWREDVPVDIRRSLMGPCTAELQRLYASLSLVIAPGARELPDHITLELEALAFALSGEETLPEARSLYFGHLRTWLPRLCRAILHASEQPFYRQLANMSCEWVSTVGDFLESSSGASLATDR